MANQTEINSKIYEILDKMNQIDSNICEILEHMNITNIFIIIAVVFLFASCIIMFTLIQKNKKNIKELQEKMK